VEGINLPVKIERNRKRDQNWLVFPGHSRSPVAGRGLRRYFSAIIIAAALFFVAWAASQTAPLLVILLAAITTRNALFYGRRVRQKALINNLE
jgi:hypothetical protein